MATDERTRTTKLALENGWWVEDANGGRLTLAGRVQAVKAHLEYVELYARSGAPREDLLKWARRLQRQAEKVVAAVEAGET